MKKYALVLLLPLAGCAPFAVQPDLPSLTAPSLPEVPADWQVAQQTVGDVTVGWIDALSDPALSELVREAQRNNRDLQAAAAAVERALALARQARSALFPTLNAVADASQAGPIDGGSTRAYSAGLQTQWEVDVWGRVRASRQAAGYSAASAEADYVFTQYSLAAAVAQTYFLMIEAGLQEQVSERNVAALRETDRIVRAQRELGAGSALDEALARSNVANAEAALIDAAGSRRLAARALEVLLGRYPGAAVSGNSVLPTLPVVPAAGVPSSLLERRPDIIAAELSIASAFSSVNAARAARLPTISLTGGVNAGGDSVSDALDLGDGTWQLAANLLGPLFDAGLRRAQVAEASASQKLAIATYAQTALNAFREVEDSLDQNAVLAERTALLAEAARQTQRAFDVAQLRYQEGETDLLDVLQIQANTFSADSALVTIQRQQLDEWINLHLALGGSWE
ncbi:MAG: efflux transporter outer membrane subunit [Pseudomonadota bacterium]